MCSKSIIGFSLIQECAAGLYKMKINNLLEEEKITKLQKGESRSMSQLCEFEKGIYFCMSLGMKVSFPQFLHIPSFQLFHKGFITIAQCNSLTQETMIRKNPPTPPPPNTWASTNDNLFQSNFSAWSSREAILGIFSQPP